MVLSSILLNIAASAGPDPGGPVLARLNINGPVTEVALPVHAHLRDGAGQEYLVVCADAGRLARSGMRFQLLDTNAVPENYMLARPMRPQPARSLPSGIRVVHDDGVQWILDATGKEVESLAESGFALARLPHDPICWTRPTTGILGETVPGRRVQDIAYDPLVAEMISRVQTNRLSALMRRLTGIEPEVADGSLYSAATRKTDSGMPIQNATQRVYEHMQALGLDAQFHNWSAGSYSSRNVVSTLPGGTLSNETVLVVAHLDNMPAGPVAPGADDNGSGTAAVLLASEICRQFQFERTIRFLLVTGEEQGLMGSAAYAAHAAAVDDNIVAVFNMDMIAWDSNGDGVLDLYTRSTSNPGYSNDLAIASVFTRVAAQYDMVTPLVPRIFPDSSVTYSDHSSFWNVGYPAVLAIEAYGADAYHDFNAYYHSTNDTLQHFNMPYFTSFVRASLGTLAHLALPAARVPVDIVEVANTASSPGIGAGTFYARHEEMATERGVDPLDQTWAAATANTNAFWLTMQTQPYGTALRTDSRPAASETIFSGTLSIASAGNVARSFTNRLRFDFLTPPQDNRLYLARVHIPGQHTATSNDFDCVTNLRPVIAGGGYFDLPALASVSGALAYGTCEIATRFLNTDASSCSLQIASVDASKVTFTARAQPGALIEDAIEASTNLVETNGWHRLASATNDVVPAADSFASGWTTEARSIEVSSLTNSAGFFFRLKRLWLKP